MCNISPYDIGGYKKISNGSDARQWLRLCSMDRPHVERLFSGQLYMLVEKARIVYIDVKEYFKK